MPDTAAAPIAPQARDPDLVGVADWCTQASSTDPRVEMLSGFHADEVAHGRLRDTAAAYASRYADFIVRPTV